MRTPTPFRDLYAWHRDYMMGCNPPRHDGDPQAGWYRTRLVKNGPWVPVEICCEREIDPETGELADDERLVATIDGRRRDAAAIWTYLTPISRMEFLRLVESRNTNPDMRATMAPMDLTERAMRP